MLDRRHDLELVQAQMPGTACPVRGPGSAEDIGDLESRRALAQPAGVPVRSWPAISVISRSSGLVTARIVRVATLV